MIAYAEWFTLGARMAYAVSNVLIDSLPEEVRNKLALHLQPVELPIRLCIYEAELTPRYVHVITSGIASIVTTMLDGGTTEVATVGREGIPEALHLLGPASVSTRCFMQIGGSGLRIDFKVMQALYEEDPAIRRMVTAYVQYQALMVSQIASCNRLHGVSARMARWMLIVQDRTGEQVLRLTQEFLAQMIGSRRTTVTEVAGKLQDRKLIEYARGSVRVMDRVGLERAACECYPITRELLKGLYDLTGQKLIGNGALPPG